MELNDVVRRRRMCRSFLDRPVDPAVVDRILGMARRAPSAGHTQGWAFVVLEGPAQTRRFWELDADPAWLEAPTHPGLLRAPVIILPLAGRDAYLRRYSEPDKVAVGRGEPGGWPAPYWLVDTSFATMVLLLAAVDEGLGALFFALHAPPEQTLAALGVPEGWEALGAVALGWAAPKPQVGGGPGSAGSGSAGSGRGSAGSGSAGSGRGSAGSGSAGSGRGSAGRGRRPHGEVVHRGGW